MPIPNLQKVQHVMANTKDKKINAIIKILLGLGLLTILAIFSCTSGQTIDEKFNGTYRLDKFESFDSVSGKWTTDKWKGTFADGFI